MHSRERNTTNQEGEMETTMEHRSRIENAPITRTYIESLRRAETDPAMVAVYDLAIARFGRRAS